MRKLRVPVWVGPICKRGMSGGGRIWVSSYFSVDLLYEGGMGLVSLAGGRSW